MAARLNGGARAHGESEPAVRLDPPGGGTGSRVLSVSPQDCATAPQEVVGLDVANSDMLITPRVLDEAAFRELAETLRGLIAGAHGAAADLRGAMKERAEHDAQTARAAGGLQERLRLGAKMLKAFQSQIARCEAVLHEIQASEQRLDEARQALDARAEAVDARADTLDAKAREVEQRLAQRMETQVDARLSEVQTRLEHMTEAAIASVEQRLANRRADLDRLDDRIEAVAPRIDALAQVVEAAEVNAAVSAHRIARITQTFEHARSDAQAVVDQCREAQRVLGDDLLAGAEHMDAVEARTNELRAALDECAQRAEAQRDVVQRRLEDVVLATETLEDAATLADRLEALVQQAAQTAHALDDAVHDEHEPAPGAPLNGSCGMDDLAALSAGMREIVERFERYASAARAAQSGAMPASPAARSTPEIITAGREGSAEVARSARRNAAGG